MPVKRSHSGSRVLTVLEAIAGHQPIGVRALAHLLDTDKSAIQRALMTLADEGWIRPSSEPPTRWEVTARILSVAHAAHGGNDLRRRARARLEQLRDDSGETVLLVVPDVHNFVVIDVVESRQTLRMVPDLGVEVAARNTATGRAVLPFVDTERQRELLGAAPDRATIDGYAAARKLGYAVSDGEINPAATNVAAPIFDFDGQPIAAVVITAPKERLVRARHDTIGTLVAKAAMDLSRGTPRRDDGGTSASAAPVRKQSRNKKD